MYWFEILLQQLAVSVKNRVDIAEVQQLKATNSCNALKMNWRLEYNVAASSLLLSKVIIENF